MKLFYIADGHRRFATAAGLPLGKAYELGYKVIVEEIVKPFFRDYPQGCLALILISRLNGQRREEKDLSDLYKTINEHLPLLISETSSLASIRIITGSVIENVPNSKQRGTLDLYMNCDTSDIAPTGEVDLVVRSGGVMRLSGSPRALIGAYTEFISIPHLHPEVKWAHLQDAIQKFNHRYMRETCDPKHKLSVD